MSLEAGKLRDFLLFRLNLAIFWPHFQNVPSNAFTNDVVPRGCAGELNRSISVTALGSDREKHHYLQGVLDGYWIKEADGKSDGETD